MSDSENNDLGKALEKLGQHIKNLRRQDEEIPIIFLSPEAHEDAMKVAKEVWVKAMELMGDSNYYAVTSPKGVHLLALLKGDRLGDVLPKTDLVIARDHITPGEGELEHLQHERFEFNPDFVIRVVVNSTNKKKPISFGF